MTYDLIVVGGGIAGASLASKVAASGRRVLVLEQETEFRDRIRGEALQPWGIVDVRALGVAEALSAVAQPLRCFHQSINGGPAMRRELTSTTPHGEPMWGFYHPAGQEVLLRHAQAQGAEVQRGAMVQRILRGAQARVIASMGTATQEFRARVVAVCAGRHSVLRAQLGFTARQASMDLLLSGVCLKNLSRHVNSDAAYVSNDVRNGTVCGLFPQPGGRARAYFGYHADMIPRLQGERDFARFQELFTATGGEAVPFGDAEPCGPLASFECVDVWLDHPYRAGVALVGDSAASNDPSWGQGLSLAFRDARVMAEELLSRDDWDAAGHRYAERHDDYYSALRRGTGWFYDIFQRLGPEADARRARALPLIVEDPTRVPDLLFTGPEVQLDERARARFFGEDTTVCAAAS